MTTNFDDIRPFNADEIPAATQRMADSDVIPAIAQYLGVPAEALRERIRSIKTLKEFQLGLLKEVIETLLKKTTTQFDWSGVENIDEKKPYLFVSNHRDIVLDAMFLQYILNEAGQNTCQITFGSNLMCHPFVIDFGKVNKMFRTERGGTPKEFYKRVAELMDSRINPHFYLHPNNYIAHDLRNGGDAYAAHYTAEQKATFIKYMDWMNDYPDFDRSELEDIFLGIYANPVEHCRDGACTVSTN